MAQKQRDEQKLWLILFQLRAIRARINWLAAQYFAFSALAIVILGAALVLAAAVAMGPLGFLLTAAAAAIAACISVVRVTRTALGSSASPIKAASLADERSGLKGRLMTVLLLSGSARSSELWRYLVEDTYGRRSEFEPAKIEPRWFSRSIMALLGACVVALLLLRVARLGFGGHSLHVSTLPSQITADLRNLDIRPADPALEPNAEIYADDATMRKLADKLASARSNGTDKDSLSRWLNKARDFAGTLQNKITGQQNRPPIELKLTDKDASSSQQPQSHHQAPAGRSNHGANHAPSGNSGHGSQAAPTPGPAAGQLAQNGVGFPGPLGNDAGRPNLNDQSSAVSGGTGNGDGVSHGSGSDPEHLFGPPSSQPLGSDTFKITIDAQPSDESSTPGAPAYIPPKVRAPLNDRQYNDEPIARASVPAADQMTIKRVFER
ncbi:MAG: hypothetical protein JO166_11525 [Deltaproteobacteria bacterium]|nr:hypothetical protein [Deltaproteobacteria bacterium]